ncbi:major facilitator superfamily domain-containing protein [Dichotomopilus funicola]|uniref:Major facilitator superfamily domain-containing protein n=1 Tax=Dichotomopilus funicola TaxID=1934379 RepID=A0AAN6ZRK2_9PEZI|nr:major facilitator superfamily domain-containing protein [Dichotomopilus funicola]
MSLHRVSSLETFTIVPTDIRSRRSSDASTRARKLTFNPLPQQWDPPSTIEQLQTVGAFQVPRWKRLLQVTTSVISCFLAAGVVFGYAAIKPVLKKEGAYRRVCTAPGWSADDEETCVNIHLNLMFTIAAVATNVVALPVGAILDHYGPRVCALLGSLFLASGALLMAFESRLAAESFDGLLLGYLLLALGGPFTYISSFQLSNAFPRHSGFILALLTGAFDASSALFLLYRIVYEKTGGAFDHRRFFLGYLLVPVAIALLQFTLMPAQSYKTVGELVEEIEEAPLHARIGSPVLAPAFDQVDEETALLQEEERQHRVDVLEGIQSVLGSAKADEQAEREEHINEISGVWGVMHGYSAWQQIKSPWFILICLFTVVQMTRINFFVATIRSQYSSLFGSLPDAIALNHFFDIALPLGGIIAIPFIGIVLDHTSTPTVLAVLVFFATAIGVLGVIPGQIWAGYANVVLFVLYRPFYYTAVSDYSAKVFGFETFGKVYGTVIALSGVLNFSQEGLDWLFERRFEGNPVPVNVMLLATGLVVGVVLVGFVSWKSKKVKRGLLEQEARGAFGEAVVF